jgi:Mg2+/Co2+ transporter CorB
LGDDVPLGALIGLLVTLLVLSAFFSGSETALMSLNRYQLRHKSRAGHRGAVLAERLLERPDRLIGLILLGNNLVNFSAASLVAIIALKMGGQPAVALGTLILTLVVLIFSEAARSPFRRRKAARRHERRRYRPLPQDTPTWSVSLLRCAAVAPRGRQNHLCRISRNVPGPPRSW